jgi:hypothetical protein
MKKSPEPASNNPNPKYLLIHTSTDLDLRELRALGLTAKGDGTEKADIGGDKTAHGGGPRKDDGSSPDSAVTFNGINQKCAVPDCKEWATTTATISINGEPKAGLPVCTCHAEAAAKDVEK